jgi:preprotein translocase subunit SecF
MCGRRPALRPTELTATRALDPSYLFTNEEHTMTKTLIAIALSTLLAAVAHAGVTEKVETQKPEKAQKAEKAEVQKAEKAQKVEKAEVQKAEKAEVQKPEKVEVQKPEKAQKLEKAEKPQKVEKIG